MYLDSYLLLIFCKKILSDPNIPIYYIMKALEYQATNETIYGFQGSIFQSKLTVFNFIESIFNNESSKKLLTH